MKKTPAIIVAEMKSIDTRVCEIYAEQDSIDNSPSAWKNFFSGMDLKPTPETKRKLASLTKELNRLSEKLEKLSKLITMEEARVNGYCCDGWDETDFKMY